MPPKASRIALIAGVFLAWVFVAFLAFGLAAGLLAVLSSLLRWPGMVSNPIVVPIAEGVAYLFVSYAFFAVWRRFGAPSWAWVLAPAGYLLSVALYFGLIWVAGNETTAESGYWTVVVVDTVSVTAGALMASRWPRLAVASDKEPGSADASGGGPADEGTQA